jgi:two-component system NtrC family sensor kinase
MSGYKNIFFSPQKSLRAMLTLWFLIFSLVPLTFITGYSLVQFEKVFSDEMLKRLNDNFIVITKSIDELKNYLKTSSDLHASDDALVFNISTKNIPNLKKMSSDWLNAGYLDQISLFSQDGQLIVAFKKDDDGFIINDLQLEKGDMFLTDALMTSIKEQKHVIVSDINPKTGFDLIAYSTVMGKKNNIAGFVQETIRIDQKFIENLKKRFNLDLIVLNQDYKPIISTVPDFLLVDSSQFSKGEAANVKFITLESKSGAYSLLIKSFEKDQANIKIGLASAKTEITAATKRINKIVFSVVGMVILFILLALWFVSRSMIKPLTQLMNAVKKLESGESDAYIANDSESEIGELTKSFNNMSRKVTKAQADLTAKVKELEEANKDLQEAQAQLVHSAKMGSLGQVVAGVAHELNNPIGFIYSNMGVLKDYIDRLSDLVETAEKNPNNLEKAKKENDYEYMIEDLPRLIQSCQDGAKRVRDIVLNLKNFSRSDELERKEYNLEEGLDSTLQILKSEFKNIAVHKDYGKIPDIYCYAGQINQVFMNILTNAIQAIDGKGDIWIKTEQKGLEIHISIKDSGKGIPVEIQEKIFDPFFTTKPVGQGTGLGLSISYGIIQKHNGQIIVESKPGKGTEFILILPLITPREG